MPNFVTTASTCCGKRAFEQQLFRLLAALRQHAVADKAVADADHGRHLRDLARDRHGVVSASGAVLSARTISHSFMTLAGEKKCMPSTSCGRFVTFAISSMLR
jgi:hypothetical protein